MRLFGLTRVVETDAYVNAEAIRCPVRLDYQPMGASCSVLRDTIGGMTYVDMEVWTHLQGSGMADRDHQLAALIQITHLGMYASTARHY